PRRLVYCLPMRTPAEHPFSSVSKGDIARRDIQQIDPKLLKHVQDAPDIGPARSELLALFRLPIHPDPFGKLWSGVEIGPREIQNKRPFHDRHFDYEQAVVATDQLRNIETDDACDSQRFQSLIHPLFAEVSLIQTKCLQGDIAWSG